MPRLCTLFLILTMLCSPFYAWAQSGTPDDPLIIDIVKGPDDPIIADLNEPTLAPIAVGYRVAEGNAGESGFSYAAESTWVDIFVIWHMNTEQAVAFMLAHPYKQVWKTMPSYITGGRTWDQFIEDVMLEWTRYNMENIMGAEPETESKGNVPAPSIDRDSQNRIKLNLYVKSSHSCTYLMNHNYDFHGRKRFTKCVEAQWYVPQTYTSGYRSITRKKLYFRKVPSYIYWPAMYRDDPCDLVYNRSCWMLIHTP
jgi:hypothetical protein